ncbi:MAG: TonB family protein [Candidatus Omnitrophica bacterium]|nr:TonB family protein [Candidatus Omnitrophota bacterium]MDD5081642.1 TonB family protein [Candidatus Omnitrophota bacterium]
MGKRFLKFLVVFIFTFVIGFSGYSEVETYLDLIGHKEKADMQVVVGEVSVFNISNPERVSIRNPEIADISKVNDNEVVIIAKQPGETVLNVWLKDEEKKTYTITVFGQDLERMQEKLEVLLFDKLSLRGIQVKKNETAGKIMLMGNVTQQEKDHIDSVLEPFNAYINNLLVVSKEDQMVEIEARILELNKTDIDKLGIKWQEYIQFREGPYTAPDSDGEGIQTTLNKVKNLWGIEQVSRDAIHARIDMLISRGNGRELSRPKLMCLSGEEATLLVGGEVPYTSGNTTGASGTSVQVEYRDYGVKLTIRPIVLGGNKIYANLKAEVSEIDWVNGITLTDVYAPAFTSRTAETVVNLNSGDTVFIAGLIQTVTSKDIDKLPALGNIPILGALFRSKDFQKRQTELVISLNPRIVNTRKDFQMPAEEELIEDEYLSKFDRYDNNVPPSLRDYAIGVQKKIISNVTYPAALYNTGWEGTVLVKLVIDQTGELKKSRIIKSSGYDLFDSEAMALVNGINYSPFPSTMSTDELEVEVPIMYRE